MEKQRKHTDAEMVVYLCRRYWRRENYKKPSLGWANLRWANLREADLSEANLRGADLSEANLRGADLSGADLSGANLSGADLSGADLSGANLSGANLRGADLSGAKDIPSIACAVTKIIAEGEIVGHKKGGNGEIISIKISSDTPRSNATGRKCRCQKALVMSIVSSDGMELTEARSIHDSSFIYRVGEVVSVPNFDTNRWNECAPGIHFFITREEAEAYN